LLAEVDNSTENCHKAINCLKKSLNVRTFKDFKIDFARTQIILGDTYYILSKFENKSNNITCANIAYEKALKVFSEREYPKLNLMIRSKIEKAKSSQCPFSP